MNKRIRELNKLAKHKETKMDNKMFNFYKKAIRELSKEVRDYVKKYDSLSDSEKTKLSRSSNTMKKIDRILTELVGDTQESMFDYLKDEAADGFLGTMYDVQGKAKINMDFNMLNERYIKRTVNKKIAGKTFSQRLYSNRSKLARQVKAELIVGATSGKSYKDMARAIAEQGEANYRQSLVIARTEGHRIRSEATQKGYEDAQALGINMQKEWMSTLDEFTRDDHGDLDGQRVGIDEMFEMDGMEAEGPGLFGDEEMDINCRCTTFTVVDDISPKLRKDNETKEVIEYKSYGEWKKDKG